MKCIICSDLYLEESLIMPEEICVDCFNCFTRVGE